MWRKSPNNIHHHPYMERAHTAGGRGDLPMARKRRRVSRRGGEWRRRRRRIMPHKAVQPRKPISI
jgi:hypothetical protein